MEAIRKGDLVSERFQNHGIIATVLNIQILDIDTIIVDIEFFYKGVTKTTTINIERLEKIK